MTGFEPAASWSQTRRSSQAEPHPVASASCCSRTTLDYYIKNILFCQQGFSVFNNLFESSSDGLYKYLKPVQGSSSSKNVGPALRASKMLRIFQSLGRTDNVFLTKMDVCTQYRTARAACLNCCTRSPGQVVTNIKTWRKHHLHRKTPALPCQVTSAHLDIYC